MTRDEFHQMLKAHNIVFVGDAPWRVAQLVAAAERERDEALLRQALAALEGVLDRYGEPLDLMSISGGLYECLQSRDAITALRERLGTSDALP